MSISNQVSLTAPPVYFCPANINPFLSKNLSQTNLFSNESLERKTSDINVHTLTSEEEEELGENPSLISLIKFIVSYYFKTFTCSYRLDQAKKTFLSCPEAKNLWKQLENEGPFTIECSGNVMTGAEVAIRSREIFLHSRSSTDNMVQGILFELNNLKRFKQFSSVNCKNERDEYATKIEKIEYETAKEAYKTSSSCVKAGHWNDKHIVLKENFLNPSPEKDWNTIEGFIKTLPLNHIDGYKSQWDERCGPESDYGKNKAIITLDLENYAKKLDIFPKTPNQNERKFLIQQLNYLKILIEKFPSLRPRITEIIAKTRKLL